MKIRVRAISLCLLLSMMLSVFFACPVQAAEAPPIYKGALKAGNMFTYNACDSDARFPGYQHTITMPYRGICSLVFERNGIYNPNAATNKFQEFHYDVTIYDAKRKVVFSADTFSQQDSDGLVYYFHVGLKAGTYYLTVRVNLPFYPPRDGLTAGYVYTVQKKACEVEPNNSSSNATAISLNKTYHASTGDGAFSGTDTYKVALVKGKKYRLYVGGMSNLYAKVGATVSLKYGSNFLGGLSKHGGVWVDTDKDGVYDNAYLDFVATRSGVHHIVVDGSTNYYDFPQDYTIKVSDFRKPVSKLKVSLSATSYTYNGKVKKPKVIVKTANGTKLKEGTHYSLKYSAGRKKVGTYTVTVKGKGKYYGTKSLKFTIRPAKTVVKKVVKSGAKALKVTWKKKTVQSSGYQVDYCTRADFKKGVKRKQINGTKYTSVKISGLKSKTIYYVRVRTFKTVSGKKYYSKWTETKRCKTR